MWRLASRIYTHTLTHTTSRVVLTRLRFDLIWFGVGLQEVTFQSLDTNGNAILDSDELEPHMLYETVRTAGADSLHWC